MLIRSGEALGVGWSRNMLYSGFNTLHRSVIWSADFNGRSDNTDVIPLKPMANISVKPAPVEHGNQIVPLLSVTIDSQLISKTFPPFDASSESIGTSTCLECYVATRGDVAFCGSLPDGLDSTDVIGIRRHQNMIYWFHQHDEWSCPILKGAAKHRIWQFDPFEYESQLGGDSSGLPDFSSTDIQRVIRFSSIPNPERAISRIPSCSVDRLGRKLLDLINSTKTDDGLQIVQQPKDVVPYEIGIERNCASEVTFDAGITEGRYALRLIRSPTYPFWLSSDMINERMAEIAE